MASPVLQLSDVTVIVAGNKILGPVTWEVKPGEHWVVLGPNGSGKSTLVRVGSLALHPSEGTVTVLGGELGKTDLRRLRARVGMTSAALLDQLRPRLTANEVVHCGLNGALEPWWHSYSEADIELADRLLDQVGLGGYGTRTLATLSSGERQRTLLARTLVNDPDVILLDEPNAGLDLGGREALVATLDSLALSGPPSVLVTHHVEDIPPSTTHLLALGGGEVRAQGPIEEVLDAELLGDLFAVAVELTSRDGRWSARAINPTPNT